MRDAAAAPSDYYETLGVDRDADAQTIKRAFRARARELHPDVSDDPAAARKFSELSEAYAALSKSSTRRLYDEFGYRGRGNGWFDPGGARAAADFLRRRGQPVGEVLVREAEAARGARRTIRWERRERCPACAGEGGAPGAAARACTACAGTGRRRVEAALSDGERLIQIESCAECSGRGRAFGERCAECDGAGERTVRASAEVHVPPGSVDGDRVRLQDGARFVTVRVRALPADQPLVRLVAVLGLLVALAFLALLLR
jgi:molecular chaperone DnaJ